MQLCSFLTHRAELGANRMTLRETRSKGITKRQTERNADRNENQITEPTTAYAHTPPSSAPFFSLLFECLADAVGVLDVLEVERALALDAGFGLVEAGGAEGEGLLALAGALGANLAREAGRLGADEPRLLVREEEVEVLKRLAGRLDVWE